MTITNLRVKVLRQPIVRAKFIPWLPATIVGRVGVSVERNGLTYLLDLDYSKFFEIEAFTPADKLIAVQGRDGVWNTISLETLRHQIGADNPNLVAISGAVTSADKLGWWSGEAEYSLTDFTAFMRSLLDDPDAESARETLGLVIGTDVQGYNSDLSDIASLAPSDDDFIQRKSGVWVNRSILQVKTDLAINNVDNTADIDKPISTAAQSALDDKADKDDLAAVATTGDYDDLTGKPYTVPAGGVTGQVLAKASSADGDTEWITGGGGGGGGDLLAANNLSDLDDIGVARENLQVIRTVTPEMYGGDLAAAIAASDRVHLSGTYNVSTPISVSKSRLVLTADSGASIKFTGSAGANKFFELYDCDHIQIKGDLTIDCDSKVAGALIVYTNPDASVFVEGITTKNSFQTSPATFDSCGIFINSPSGLGRIASVRHCTVENVDRDVVAGFCAGITVTKFLSRDISYNKISGVYRGGGADADGIRSFGYSNGTSYVPCVETITNNFIENCEGRFVKTQSIGSSEIRNNYFCFSESLDLLADATLVDAQVDGSVIADNVFDLKEAWTGGASATAIMMRVPTTAPDFSGRLIKGSILRNKFTVNDSAPKMSYGFILGLTSMASRDYNVAFEIEDNYMIKQSGWGSGNVVNSGIYIQATPSQIGTAHIKIRNNSIDSTYFMISLPSSGGTAAHGGLGDLTGKLFLEVGNNNGTTSAQPVMTYDNNSCFTSSIRVYGNSIGTLGNQWGPPFDFAKILSGCELSLGDASIPSPSYLNAPSSPGYSTVSRVGNALWALNKGGTKYADSFSYTPIGTTPSWT